MKPERELAEKFLGVIPNDEAHEYQIEYLAYLVKEHVNEQLQQHSVMQGLLSDCCQAAVITTEIHTCENCVCSCSPTVGQRSVDTNAEARVNCAEGKHFWSMNKGIQVCLFCPARREAPSGGHL